MSHPPVPCWPTKPARSTMILPYSARIIWTGCMCVAFNHSIPRRSWRMTSCFQRLRQSPSCGLVRGSPSGLQGGLCKLWQAMASYGKLWQAMAYGTAAFTLSGCIGKCIGETISIAVSLCSSCAVGFFQVGLKMIIIENQIDWKSDFFTKCFAAWCFSLRVRCCKLHGCSKVLGWQGAGQTSPVCAAQKEHLPTAIPSPPSIPSRSFSGLWLGRLLCTFSKEPRLISLRHFAGMFNQLSWVTQEGWAGMPGMPRSQTRKI